MGDADRSDFGGKAYNDFIESLAKVQQLSPLESEFIGATLPKGTDESKIPEGLTAQQLAEKANWSH